MCCGLQTMAEYVEKFAALRKRVHRLWLEATLLVFALGWRFMICLGPHATQI
jgi:hypothetical protein